MIYIFKSKKIEEALETYSNIRTTYNIEKYKTCKDYALSKEFCQEYGIERTSLLSGILELFYQKGKEDALKELKDKL
jgi:hypothetical protein